MIKLTQLNDSAQRLDRGHSPESSSAGDRQLVVAHVVEGCKGGVGTAVRHLVCGQAIDEAIGSIHILADPDRMGDMLIGAPASFHPYKSSRNFARMRQVARDVQAKLQNLEPDIVYLHSTFPGVYGRLRLDRRDAAWATIYCAHGWAFTQRVPRLIQKIYEGIERHFASRADAIVSISHYEHAAAIKAGIDHPRHLVIPHGIPAAGPDVQSVIQPEGSGIHLLFVGRFDQQKGVDLLFDAWRDIRLSDMHLWLIGDTTLDQETRVPDQPNVHPLGWIRNDLMDGYIRSFHGVIMPSRWEGFGLVALEAMRNGRAVLASRAGGLSELVIDRVNGRLFDPEDREELIRMLLSLTHRDLIRMGEHASEVFHAAFEWDTCYRRWRDLAHETWLARCTVRSK